MSQTPSFFLVLTLLALGCQQDGSIGGDGVVVGLTRADPGAMPVADGEMIVLWNVTSGSPDYEWIAGRGTFDDAGFELSLPMPMQAEAINSYGVGVGIVLAGAVANLPDGLVTEEVVESNIVGGIDRNAIIYIAPDADPILGWAEAFPVGFSCAVGVEADDDDTFGTFEPISCDEMELRIGDINDFNFIEWT